MRGNGIFGPWELWRKIAFFLSLAIGVFLFFVLYVPVGIVLLAQMLVSAAIWKPVGVVEDPRLGTYMINTIPYKFAAFFTALSAKRPEVATPLVALGFGSPGPDRDHGLEPGWMPPTRLSAYWSLVAALILGTLDILLIDAHHHMIEGLIIPWFLVYPFSVIGFFATFQIANAIRRIQGDSTSIVATEPKPAVMLDKSRAEIPLRNLIPRALIISSLPVALLIIVSISLKWDWFITLPIAAVMLGLGGLIVASRIMAKKYIEGWEMRNERREAWIGIFQFMKDKNPILVAEIELPTLEEFEHKETTRVERANRMKREGEPLEEPDMYIPQVKVAIFQFPPNAIFQDYVGKENLIKGLLGVETCAISPIGNISNGQEVPGTIGSSGFRVWWSEHEPVHFLDRNIDDWTREFLVRSKVISALASVRAIGYCTLLTCGMITRPDSEKRIIEVKVVPDSDVNLESFLNNIEQIRSTLDVQWVRVGKLSRDDGLSGAVSLFIGDFPEMNQIKFVNPQSIVRRQIDKMDWSYYFNAQGLRGIDGVPRLVERRPATEIVDKLVFRLPDGMPFEAVPNKKSSLMSTSGYTFMEIEQGDEDSTKRMTETEKIQQESQQEARFTLIASKTDPLKRVFNFGDYSDKILRPRIPGTAQINWYSGVLADDTLAEYSWDSEEPHLLIAGSSGSGKSVVSSSMILQLAHNNGPSELVMWMVEPKSEMQVYRNIDVVERFVDSWSPDDNFMTNAADMMEDAVVEMNRRNKEFVSHPKHPKKLEKAREIAMRESEANGTPLEDHPLYMPYMIIILEECATLFADAANREEKMEQGRLLSASAEIARKARSAGIYLVALTQYPTNASIPSVIRNQMRRIGLKCQNDLASRVVIGENGLENIKTKGVGMVSANGIYRAFRGFWVKDGDPDNQEPNDILDIVASLPTRQNMVIGSGGQTYPEIYIPDPSTAVFNAWDSIVGRQLFTSIESKQQTKDVVEV